MDFFVTLLFTYRERTTKMFSDVAPAGSRPPGYAPVCHMMVNLVESFPNSTTANLIVGLQTVPLTTKVKEET